MMQDARSQDLPDALPVFPLNGVLLLPGGRLPLNIFEPRFVAMVEDVLKTDRIIGMIQPRNPGILTGDDTTPLFETGCAGRITAFEEQDDGRFLVTLTGISRFHVAGGLPLKNGYRRVTPDWTSFAADRDVSPASSIDRLRLRPLLEAYFSLHDMTCDWDAFENAPDRIVLTCLAMVCPFGPGEKQALLEAPCCSVRAELFMTMLDMAVRGGETGEERH